MSPVLILGCHFQIAFTVMAFKNPANMPASLASLNLVQGAARNFALSVYNMVSRSQSIVGHFSAVRDLYEVRNIQNEVPDGDLPLVCNPETSRAGVQVCPRTVRITPPANGLLQGMSRSSIQMLRITRCKMCLSACFPVSFACVFCSRNLRYIADLGRL